MMKHNSVRIKIMNETEFKKASTDSPMKTEAVMKFTKKPDNTRHRFRFVSFENRATMHRIHEIKLGRQWQTVGIEAVDRLCFDIAESGKLPVE